MIRTVIVGSEPNSLVAALLLARAGHGVQLLTGSHFGGVTRLMGNARLDSDLAAELEIELPMPKQGRLGLSPAGARVSLRREAIEGDVTDNDKARWPEFVRLLDDAAALWRQMSFGASEDLVENWRGLGRRHSMEVLRLPWHNLRDFLNEWFESELLKATIASAALFGTRQGPFASGTAFLLLRRWARDEILSAAPAPLDALTEALLRAGVAIQKEHPTKFEVEDGKVRAVTTTTGRNFEADLVISGEDPVVTWKERVGLFRADPEIADALENWKISSTVGTASVEASGFSEFGVVSLADTVNSLERAYDRSKYGESSVTPFGEFETGSPRVWVQHLVGQGSKTMIDPFCKSFGLTAFDRLSPEDIERGWGVTGGHLYGGDPVLWQSLWLRDVFSQPLENLYLCGPGVGTGDYSGLNGKRVSSKVLEGTPAATGA